MEDDLATHRASVDEAAVSETRPPPLSGPSWTISRSSRRPYSRDGSGLPGASFAY